MRELEWWCECRYYVRIVPMLAEVNTCTRMHTTAHVIGTMRAVGMGKREA